MDNVKLLMEILKDGVIGGNDLVLPSLTKETLNTLCAISEKHDLAHVVGYVLKKYNALDDQTEIGKKFNNQMMLAVFRTTKLDYDFRQICDILEELKTPYIPLKGSVIRAFYPERWLRTSCDIDILIPNDELKRVCDYLVKNGFKRQEKGFHCVSFNTISGMNLELHFNLNELDNKLDCVLNEVWNYVGDRQGYCKDLTDEFFIFYLVSHIVTHFKNGGCGIRAIMDLWLVLNKFLYDENILNELLEKAEILTFYKAITKLTKVWFENEEHDDLTQKMQNFIITGGVYGTMDNKINVSIANKKTGKNHLVFRIFPSYYYMKSWYPILEKCKILLPFYWVKRWFKIFKGDRMQRAANEVKVANNIERKQVEDTKDMLSKLGLG